MKTRFSNLLPFFLFIVSLTNPLSVFSLFPEHIKYGLFPMQGFQENSNDSDPKGYNIEYLSLIAKQNNWVIDYIVCENKQDAIAKLENGQIDITGLVLHNFEDDKQFLFSNFSIGIQQGAIFTLEVNQYLGFEEFDAFSSITFGIVKDSSLKQTFLEYAQFKDFVAKTVVFDTEEEMMDALYSRKIQAVVTYLENINDTIKPIAKLEPKPSYFLIGKNKYEIKQRLDEAITVIKKQNPQFENRLLRKYLSIYSQNYFSKKEQTFIEQAPELVMGYQINNQPLSYYEKDPSNPKGITIDILDLISKRSGLKFSFKPFPVNLITFNVLQEYGFDLVSGVTYENVNRNIPYLLVSSPYLESQNVIITKKDNSFSDQDHLLLAHYSGLITEPIRMSNDYPNFDLIYYNSIEECINAVKTKKADAMFCNRFTISEYIKNLYYSDLEILPNKIISDYLSIGILTNNNEADSLLLSIINKTITSITEEEILNIVISNTTDNKNKITFADILYKYRFAIILITVISICIILIIHNIQRYNKKNKDLLYNNEQRIIFEHKRTKMIVEKSGDIIFEFNLENGELTISSSFMEKFGWSFPKFIDTKNANQFLKTARLFEEDKNKLNDIIKEIITKNIDVESKIRILKTDGSNRWCQICLYPLLNTQNKLIAIVGKIIDIDKVTKETETLKLQAQTDSLTGLLNKVTFIEKASEFIHSSKNDYSAIVFIDLDNFKNINDVLGHLIGDTAIQSAAQRIQIAFSNFDLISRFGGDEFCILVKNIQPIILYDRLDWCVEKLKHTYGNGNASVTITASIGAALYPDHGTEIKELISKADKALYISKENGKNQVTIYNRKL